MPDHPLTKLSSGASLYVQNSKPTETPQPAPNGSGGVWLPTEKLTAGEVRYTHDYNSQITGRFGIEDEVVVYPVSDGNVYAYDIDSGEPLWSYRSSSASRSVSIQNNTVLTDADGTTALDLNTGDKLWSINPNAQYVDAYRGYAVFTDNGTIYVHDLTDGTQIWTNSLSSSGGFVTYQDSVIVGDGSGNVLSLSIYDGTQNWSTSVAGSGIEGPFKLHDGDVITPYLSSIDAETGNLNWKKSLDFVRQTFAIADGIVIAGEDFTTDLYGINVSDGTQNWVASPDSDYRSGVTVADGAAVVGSASSNNLYGIDITDGSTNWSFTSLSGTPESDISSYKNRAFVGTGSGTVYQMNINDSGLYDNVRVSDGDNWVIEQ